MRKALTAAILSAAFMMTGGILDAPAPLAAEAAQPARARTQTGTIISIDEATRTFVCKWEANDYTYKTTNKTVFRFRGQKGSWSDLKLGVRVSLGYSTVGKDRVANWVTIEQ